MTEININKNWSKKSKFLLQNDQERDARLGDHIGREYRIQKARGDTRDDRRATMLHLRQIAERYVMRGRFLRGTLKANMTDEDLQILNHQIHSTMRRGLRAR